MPLTWQKIAKTVPVTDLKDTKLYSLNVGGELAEVPKSGPIEHGRLKESGYNLRAKTYGQIIGISREDIINDDLGGFATVPASALRKAVPLAEAIWFGVRRCCCCSLAPLWRGNRGACSFAFFSFASRYVSMICKHVLIPALIWTL